MEKKSVLVFGGTGALGSDIVEVLKQAGWDTTCVDIRESSSAAASIVVTGEAHEVDSKSVAAALADKKFDLIVGVAGGWTGGSIAAPSVLTSVDKMIKLNLNSAIVSAYIAQRHLTEGGLLALTGASSALEATPMMIGYGITKAAVHQLVLSLGDEKSKMPKDSTTVGILPVTLDTPANRQSMPKADFSTWTPTSEVAKALLAWAEGKNRPKSGSLMEVTTENGTTKWVSVTISVTRNIVQ